MKITNEIQMKLLKVFIDYEKSKRITNIFTRFEELYPKISFENNYPIKDPFRIIMNTELLNLSFNELIYIKGLIIRWEKLLNDFVKFTNLKFRGKISDDTEYNNMPGINKKKLTISYDPYIYYNSDSTTNINYTRYIDDTKIN